MAVTIPLITSFDGKGIRRAQREFAQLEGVGQKAGFVISKSMLGVAAGAAALGGTLYTAGQQMFGMVEAALEDQKSQRQLAASILASTKASKAQIAQMESYVDVTQRAYGVADDQLRPALGRLVRSTKDLGEAQKLLNIALDVSAATGKPLEAVANALGKAFDGQMAAVGRLGLGIDKATLKGMDFAELQKVLSDRFGGAAQQNANTFEGQVNRLRIRFDELKESIGYKLLPFLQKLADKAIKIADAFNQNGIAGGMIEFQRQLPGVVNTLGTIYNGVVAVTNAFKALQRGVARILNLAAPFGGKRFGESENAASWEDIMAGFKAEVPAPIPANAAVSRGRAGLAGPVGGTAMSMPATRTQKIEQYYTIQVTSADPRAVVDALVKYNRQNGAIPIKVR